MATDKAITIEALKEARDSGVKRVTVDGTSTEFASMAELNSLIRQLESEEGTTKRPTVFHMKLGGAW